jgi:hypothetical protein
VSQRHRGARLHITSLVSLSPGGPSFNPTEVLDHTYFFAIFAPFTAIPDFVFPLRLESDFPGFKQGL